MSSVVQLCRSKHPLTTSLPIDLCNDLEIKASVHYELRLVRQLVCVNQNTSPLILEIDWILDGGYLPHSVLRVGIRQQLKSRLTSIDRKTLAEATSEKQGYIDRLRKQPIAISTDTANTQHYEVGTGVLAACLGPRMKYSCCLYPTGKETLAQAEEAMLAEYIEKAELKDGMRILDLG